MAETIVWSVVAYLGVGVIFGLAFVARGVGAVDAGARGAPWAFRVLILPGTAALWPVMLRKWLRSRRDRGEGVRA